MGKSERNEPRKQPTQERARVTVDAIVVAAERVLAREGTERATTNRIAEVAGVSIGSLYQYFPNKQTLVEIVRERSAESFDTTVGAQIEALAALPLREAVRGCVTLLIARHRETLALHNALAAEQTDFHERIEARWMPLVLGYLEAHRDELRPANLALAARVAFDTIEALTHGAALRQPELLDDPAYADELSELLFRYLAK